MQEIYKTKMVSGKSEKELDKRRKSVIIMNVRQSGEIAGLCKGSTADSDSVCEGSNPSPAARKKRLLSTRQKALFERCAALARYMMFPFV